MVIFAIIISVYILLLQVRHNGEAFDVNPKFEAKQKYLKRIGVFTDFESGKLFSQWLIM